MPTGTKYMGWWGNMGGPKQKGIASYTLSPHATKPMRGVFAHWAINGTKRIAQQAPYFVAPLGIGYAILQYCIADNHLRNSKEGHIQGKFP
ncbi:ubiquinol-cytochrome c reductase subunit 8 [Pseudohyphozyma bogoriensis]|nr:ubiquinol-cytochrome c reductase subunit 8 [Pseudohyphozyma bogoriensis]